MNLAQKSLETQKMTSVALTMRTCFNNAGKSGALLGISWFAMAKSIPLHSKSIQLITLSLNAKVKRKRCFIFPFSRFYKATGGSEENETRFNYKHSSDQYLHEQLRTNLIIDTMINHRLTNKQKCYM